MISSIIFIVFFFILVLFYPAVSLVLSVSAWVLKRRAGGKNITDKKLGEIIDKKIDKLKDLVFIISVFFIFFFVAPFAVFYIINTGAIKLISW
ncbi:MAG: hypothetical protein SRB2_02097 [Desulfobacteraceae bacterium Eth-SRB2]|nr:MAG: hypothetical protein SRB2_02097 [Desulfobacteraceae bacterium Eth-SRB2]